MLIFDFVNEFSERQEITLDDFPIKITAVSPKGSEQMKKIFRIILLKVYKNAVKCKTCGIVFHINTIPLLSYYNN